MVKFTFKLHFWPILTVLWFVLTFVISFTIAVTLDHVYILFPYISDTGTTPPESNIFGQMLNIGAVILFITMFIRHRVIKKLLSEKKHNLWSTWGLVFGVISCFGISLVGNFPETINIYVHMIGATLAFAVGGFYCIAQAYLSWSLKISQFLKIFRIITSALILPLYLLTLVATSMSLQDFTGDDQLQWDNNYEAYDMHLVATFSEWAMVLSMLLHLFTFYIEFKMYETIDIIKIIE